MGDSRLWEIGLRITSNRVRGVVRNRELQRSFDRKGHFFPGLNPEFIHGIHLTEYLDRQPAEETEPRGNPKISIGFMAFSRTFDYSFHIYAN
jgi:hypothetical protein